METKKRTRKTTTKKTAQAKAPATKKAVAKDQPKGAKATGAKTAAPKTKKEAKPEAAKAATAKKPKQAKVPSPEKARDPRIPEPGTVIQKRDRHNKVRCECTVEENESVRYNGTQYRSLSAAAMAAAKDLGLGGRAQNGFTFWGLSKPTRKDADPLPAIDKAWKRYRDRLEATIKNRISDENRDRVRALVEQHSEAMIELREGAR